MERLDRYLLEKITDPILNENNVKKIIMGLEKLRTELLNQSRSRTLKLKRELAGVQRKIDNLVEAVVEGVLPRELIKDKLAKLKADKDRLEAELAYGRVTAFPKINVSTQFIKNFRAICKDRILQGDITKRRTFIRSFVKKTDLTKTTCKATYDLARLLAAQEDISTLRVGLVARVIIERWRQEYNTYRPHSSLGYRPPAPEAVVTPSEMTIQPWSYAKDWTGRLSKD